MFKDFTSLSADVLRARHAQISPIILTLFKSWNEPGLAAAIALRWRFNEPDMKFVGLELLTEGETDSFREFIHNLCTQLSAEKLYIEGLLMERGEPILQTR